MRRTSIAVTLAIALAPACGSDANNDPDAPPGAPDAAPDASPSGSPLLLGTWRDIPSNLDPEPVPIEQRAVLVLAADGTYSIIEDGTTETATWTADDGTMTVIGTDDEGESHTIVLDYVVTADRLMMGALFPVGAVDGTVGTWQGHASVDGTAIVLTLELRADNTAHYERQQGTEAPEVFDGTWGYQVDDVVFTTMIDTTTVNLHLKELPGVTIGGPLYERLASARRATGVARAAAPRIETPILAPLRR